MFPVEMQAVHKISAAKAKPQMQGRHNKDNMCKEIYDSIEEETFKYS